MTTQTHAHPYAKHTRAFTHIGARIESLAYAHATEHAHPHAHALALASHSHLFPSVSLLNRRIQKTLSAQTAA